MILIIADRTMQEAGIKAYPINSEATILEPGYAVTIDNTSPVVKAERNSTLSVV